ncbi:hypothetical protein LCGC14_1389130 [marine sediment metagenome]|uniref:Uncharacterized protein n=1 Tax=marine sediment metagenome TaxID=412755 RepID=A0A0F9K0N2_9ZZZZ
MKKILILLFIGILLISVVIAVTNNKKEYTTLAELETKTLNKTENKKVMDYYKSELKEATEVKEYKTDGTHVVIEFKGTDYRVVTSKKKFDNLVE